jgi:hypothetical protein
MEKKPHRKAWEAIYGKIPVDEEGRSYEIHHINRDHRDNRIENLQCVTIREHFDIHVLAEDWGAVAAIARRMKVTPEEQKRLNQAAGKSAKERQLGWHDPALKEHFRQGAVKGGQAHRGMRWFNDGKTSTKSMTSPGEGWTSGRLLPACGRFGYEPGRKLGVFWRKDGVSCRSIECPGEGWMPGRGPNKRPRR